MHPFFLAGMLLVCAIPAPVYAAAAAQAVTGTACPSSNFKGFIAAYSSDPKVRANHTMPALRYQHVDFNGERGPKVVHEVIKQLPRFYVDVLVQPKMGQENLTPKTKAVAGGMTLDLYDAQSDRLISYTFRHAGRCWALEKLADNGM